MKICLASQNSVILYFGNEISEEISTTVKNYYNLLLSQKNESLLEIIPSYTSILITYDIFSYDFNSIKNYLNNLKISQTIRKNNSKTIITIDVYYGFEVALDLKRISEISNLSIDEVVKKHSSKIYDVYAMGFLPGFAFLASVDEQISIPRLETPRKRIEKGSVAIANSQTAIYPQNSPGGWNIIGKTTFELFDKNLLTLSPLTIESRVKFNSISKEEFLLQGGVL